MKCANATLNKRTNVSRCFCESETETLVGITFAPANSRVAFHSGETALVKLISCRLSVTLPLSPQTPISTRLYPRLPDLRKQAISFPSLGWERGMRQESREEGERVLSICILNPSGGYQWGCLHLNVKAISGAALKELREMEKKK